MPVTVSAPGKVHLIGDHAVVYGEPAILAAIGKRTTIRAEKGERVRISDRQMGPDLEWGVEECKQAASQAAAAWQQGFEKKGFSQVFPLVKGSDFKKVAVGHALNSLGIESGVSLDFTVDVPMGAGVGSSASLAVGIAKAVAEVYGKDLALEEVNRIAFEIERFKHGTPSGGDNSACCFGGLIWFEKSPLNILSLREEIPYQLENFLLVNTGTPEKSTGELVQMVRGLSPEIRDPAVKAIGAATHEMRAALREKDFGKVQELINVAQENLKQLGVSTPTIDQIAEKIRGMGGAAKLCGAGGGGVMLCYHGDKEKMINVIKSLGYQPLEADLGVEGVRVEE